MLSIDKNTQIPDSQKEIDEIYLLLTYSIVYSDWQSEELPRNQRRGYNIGTVIVNKSNEPVFAELNCINSTDNATQHGEVRAITGYLEKNKGFNLNGFTLYTTLEPCIMCAGMITMTAFKRVVFGQKDFEYSHAFERFAIDTRSVGGFAPYPRKVEVYSPIISISIDLDRAFNEFLQNDSEKILAKFLSSCTAKEIFSNAEKKFLNYQVKYPENQEVYHKTLTFYHETKKEKIEK